MMKVLITLVIVLLLVGGVGALPSSEYVKSVSLVTIESFNPLNFPLIVYIISVEHKIIEIISFDSITNKILTIIT